MHVISNLLRKSAALPVAVASAALFFLMILTFCDVVLRSAFNAPIEAATELTRISMAITVFAVMPVMSARGEHISVDLLDGVFQRLRLTRIRDAIVFIGCGVMLYWPAGRVVVLAERARDYGDVTEYLGIPVFYMGWFIAIMTYLTMMAMVLRGLAILFAPQLLERQS
ncbi:TRAP transporter small permease subunit [Alisedimentitalea sp. MJ-SS2]|uniref:TRAP transporter small permease n=1 Tax=Aliisedimentitalea sp. MJ-SS2 TaxID=3049795 RepID=UPI00290F0FED|nr:TRAP transporter small permease subunit [Alisedimentitalea sp. MJ-SS2]MDU8925825.1 TRAP transporter small permease subunit [Alisedimentitalea sp. MJ-SS2]